MSKKEKKAQQLLEKISLFRTAGFTEEQIEKHFKNKQAEKSREMTRKKKAKEKPLARIYKGLNTNAM